LELNEEGSSTNADWWVGSRTVFSTGGGKIILLLSLLKLISIEGVSSPEQEKQESKAVCAIFKDGNNSMQN
jgi:hypothetical protein